MLSNGVFSNVRVAMGAVAPTPIRARSVEKSLEGKPLEASTIETAASIAGAAAAPIDDVRASAWYRDHLIRVLTKEALSDLHENAD